MSNILHLLAYLLTFNNFSLFPFKMFSLVFKEGIFSIEIAELNDVNIFKTKSYCGCDVGSACRRIQYALFYVFVPFKVSVHGI